jgi:hypothetical protein
MLEEKNDNLLEADGTLEKNAVKTKQTDKTSDSIKENLETIPETEGNIKEPKLSETDIIIDAIADNNAEESEDETLKERHAIRCWIMTHFH